MTEHKKPVKSTEFKDRKAGLIVFGILLIIIGVACLLIVFFTLLSMIVVAVFDDGSAAPINVGIMISTGLFYVLLVVWFIWMGIGSIQARRWARALVLVSSWIWLIGGISTLIYMLLFMPDINDQMSGSGQIPQETAIIMKYVMFGFITIFFVVIPGIFILFYGNKNVKATCEFRDARVRWTDKCPLPVLAVSLIFAAWAVSMLPMGFYGWVVPFFGYILSGTVGAGVVITSMLLCGYVAWGTYKLDLKAWWYAILLTIAWTLSTGITFSGEGLWEFYRKMNFSEEQLNMMKEFGMQQNFAMDLSYVLWVIGSLGYLLYTRRYFTRPSETTSPTS